MQNTSLPLTRVQSHTGLHHRSPVAMAFNPDGTLLVSASPDSSVFIFGTDNAALLAAIELDVHLAPTCIAWQDPSSFWLASSDGSVVLWALSRNSSSPMSVRIADALPYYFPVAPSLIRVRSPSESGGPSYVVVGFGNTFEVWQRPHGTRRLRSGGSRKWQPRGKATSTGSAALMAWPLSRESVLVVVQNYVSRVWKFDDDKVTPVHGWPVGTLLDGSAFIPSPYAPASGVTDPEHLAHIVGHVVLIEAAAAVVHIMSLTLEPIPYVNPLRVVHLSPTVNPSVGVTTSWSGLPTLIMADGQDICAFDLSAATFQQATALKAVVNGVPASVTSNDLRTLNLAPNALQVSLVSSFSGRFVRLVAAAHPAVSGGTGYAVSVWSTSEGISSTDAGAAAALQMQHRVPRVRVHIELGRFVAQTRSMQSKSLLRARVLLATVVVIITAIAAHRLGLGPISASQCIYTAGRFLTLLRLSLLKAEAAAGGHAVDGDDTNHTDEGSIIYLP